MTHATITAAAAPFATYCAHVVSASRRTRRKLPSFDGYLDVDILDIFSSEEHCFNAEVKFQVQRELYKQGVPDCWDPDDWRVLSVARKG